MTQSKGKDYQYQITDDKLFSNGNSNEINNFFKEIIVKINAKKIKTETLPLREEASNNLTVEINNKRLPVRNILFSNDYINAIKNEINPKTKETNLRIIQQFLKGEIPNPDIVINWVYDNQTRIAINEYRNEYRKGLAHSPQVIEKLNSWEFKTIKDFLNKQEDNKFTINDGKNIHTLIYDEVLYRPEWYSRIYIESIEIFTHIEGKAYNYRIYKDKLYSTQGNTSEIKKFFRTILKKIEAEENKAEKKK